MSAATEGWQTIWKSSAATCNQCMSSPLQLLNPEAEQHLAEVGEGFFWMMSAAQEKNLASLSVETLELVFTTVDTLRMLVLCVQVCFLTWKSTIHSQHNCTDCLVLSFFRLCHSWPHKTILHSFRRRPSSYLFGNYWGRIEARRSFHPQAGH